MACSAAKNIKRDPRETTREEKKLEMSPFISNFVLYSHRSGSLSTTLLFNCCPLETVTDRKSPLARMDDVPEDIDENVELFVDGVGDDVTFGSNCRWIWASFSILFSNRLTSRCFFSALFILILIKSVVSLRCTPTK